MTINIPKEYYPTIVSHKKQQPIVIVPEIVYPHKKKRIVVHHESNLLNLYDKMAFGSINPHYMKWAQENPAYQEMLKTNAFHHTVTENKMYADGIAQIPKLII
jgi:hypothetical protein